MKKNFAVVLTVAAVVAAGAGGARYLKNDTAQAVAPTTAPGPTVVELAASEISEVRKTDLRFNVPLAGTLRPVDQTTLKSEVAAKVSEVLVQEGQPVKKGDVLVRLDTEDLETRLNERVANLESAKAQLVLAEKNRSMKLSLQQKGYAAQASVNEVESSYRAAQASVRAQQAQVDLARKALEEAVVKAPMDGFVSERAVNPGDKVPVDGKLLTLIDLAKLEIEAPVPTNEIALVAVGQKASFRVPGIEGREFSGRVERINPTTKAGSRSIPVYIRVENGDQVLRGGMFASGDIVVREVKEVVAVPPEAVRGDADRKYVLKLDGGKIARQSVEVSEDATATLVAVKSGLSEGDTVVSAPSIILEPGTPVRIGGK
ncbi:efflux RND transporter periplasmic adaptor subunit [Microvirga lenta]|uniref:efflux RND transporter periplasmic adaptor subunit n=1 Tax=Microvirga lenta TaxID=2881337 RepID=UPI001CFFEC7A|nr:efflux RND transporter periplasmic adaptor subunit [Microvirga lenta]MCB5176689.1 efflux RND transporter periplasmic adaptor subunit [Microvirga lenta]